MNIDFSYFFGYIFKSYKMAQMYCGGIYEYLSLILFLETAYLLTDEVPAVVADIGAANCKTGTAGQDSPRHTFKSVGFSLYLL